MLLLPLVLYRIHTATNRLMMESQNLKHWWMVTRTSEAVLSYPSQMAAHSVSVQDSYHVRNVTNSVNTSVTNSAHEREADSDGTYSFQCGAEEIIQNILKDKLTLVRSPCHISTFNSLKIFIDISGQKYSSE